jgi:hypothetical protein
MTSSGAGGSVTWPAPVLVMSSFMMFSSARGEGCERSWVWKGMRMKEISGREVQRRKNWEDRMRQQRQRHKQTYMQASRAGG